MDTELKAVGGEGVCSRLQKVGAPRSVLVTALNVTSSSDRGSAVPSLSSPSNPQQQAPAVQSEAVEVQAIFMAKRLTAQPHPHDPFYSAKTGLGLYPLVTPG